MWSQSRYSVPLGCKHKPSFVLKRLRSNATTPTDLVFWGERGSIHGDKLPVADFIPNAFRLQPAQLIGGPDWLYDNWIHNVILGACAVLVLARAAFEPVARKAWLSFGIALMLWFIGSAAWDVFYAGDSHVPYPSFADVLAQSATAAQAPKFSRHALERVQRRGITLDQPVGWVYRFENGLAVWAHQYRDAEQARLEFERVTGDLEPLVERL